MSHFSGFVFPDILYLHRGKKICFLNIPNVFGVLFDGYVDCSHLFVLCLESSRALNSCWRHFFPSAERPSMAPIRWQSLNNPGEAGAHLHDSPAHGMTPEYSIEKDAEKVICRKSTEAESTRRLRRPSGGSNKARQRGGRISSESFAHIFFFLPLSLFSQWLCENRSPSLLTDEEDASQ